jgi:hypothetical protein
MLPVAGVGFARLQRRKPQDGAGLFDDSNPREKVKIVGNSWLYCVIFCTDMLLRGFAMRHNGATLAIALIGLVSLHCASTPRAYAQSAAEQTDFYQTFQSALGKAQQQCTTLWSDHAFDTLRKKISLNDDESPTIEMLTNTERVRPKDKPIADLAIKTLAKCRAAYAPAFALLPPGVVARIHATQRQQDALVAELYSGKITYGQFNVGANRILGQFSEALYGAKPPETPAVAPAASKIAEQTATSTPPKIERTPTNSANQVRLALVIGNSKYANLPKLANPANDARAIADVFKKMGYKTQLLLDAPDQTIRQSVRAFANESDKADTAVVFYAGHGAQVNGNNYLLPVDIDVPRTEADIQFTGLKVDDLVNSIRSNIKIVFLDACRDNPALFKNIVKGRGASPVGLAPASGSNFDQKPGGGVFIAYATDAGAVADDGQGKHSPFTEALLRNLQKPISIDDMFSLVTREVRLVTKNAQRPYKYASLENIICVTPACSSVSTPATLDVVQEAKQSEAEELRIALATKNVDALETYLEKYPDTLNKTEILGEIGNLRRAEFSEWTVFEWSTSNKPQYIKLSSIRQFGDRASAQIRYLIENNSQRKLPGGASIPDGSYQEDVNVYDCTKLWMAAADQTIYGPSGDVLYHYKYADPQYLQLGLGFALSETSIGAQTQKLVCRAENALFLASKKQIASGAKFESLSTMVNGEGEMFYRIVQNRNVSDSIKEILVLQKLKEEREMVLKNGTDAGFKFAYELDDFLLSCSESKSTIIGTSYYKNSLELAHISVSGPAWFEFKEFSPIALLRNIVCNKQFAGIGIQFTFENRSFKIVNVQQGDPADKAGIKVGDVITQIDNQPLQGIDLEKAYGMLRGAVDTEVKLSIVRDGESKPIEFSVVRKMVRMRSAQEQEKK